VDIKFRTISMREENYNYSVMNFIGFWNILWEYKGTEAKIKLK
jgi:hypothetical protein